MRDMSFAEAVGLASAIFTLIGGWVAYRAIQVQRAIARQRAAVDFFIKTEMDKPMLKAFDRYNKAVPFREAAANNSTTMQAFKETDNYRYIRAYLNIHELIAVALRMNVFDEDVCYHFWSDILVRHCAECAPLIRFLRHQSNGAATYVELEVLNERWKVRVEKWRKNHPVPAVA